MSLGCMWPQHAGLQPLQEEVAKVRGSQNPTQRNEQVWSLSPPVTPQEPGASGLEEAASYIFPLLNICSAQKQYAQAPGDINILIPISHADEGGRLPLSWNANSSGGLA